MKAFLAIIRQTVRSAVRSKVFLVLFALILLCVIGLPLTIKGDNTAAGLVQISLTYSLNVVIALISASTLWLGCSLVATDVESYNIHMISTKPCPRWIYWLGKACGIFLMHGFILVVAMGIIYGLTMLRLSSALKSGFFSQQDMDKLYQETLVGRRQFRPTKVDLGPMIAAEYEKRIKDGRITPSQDKKSAMDTIKTELVGKIMRNITIKPGEEHTWHYEDVRLAGKDAPLYLRFRIYSGDITDTNQKIMPIDWGFEIFQDAEGNPVPAPTGQRPILWYSSAKGADGDTRVFMMPGGSWQELSTVPAGRNTYNDVQLPLHSSMLVGKEGKDQGKVVLHFHSHGDKVLPDQSKIPANDQEAQEAYQLAVKGQTSVFQVADGPVLLSRVTGFANNYLRTMLMAVFQLLFLTVLGCTVGAIFSTPVAVFVAIAYLVCGMVVGAAVDAPITGDDGGYLYKNAAERVLHYMARGVEMVVVTVDDLDCTSDLANGRLVEWRSIGGAFLKVLLLRSGLLAILGIWVLQKREFGLVVRKL